MNHLTLLQGLAEDGLVDIFHLGSGDSGGFIEEETGIFEAGVKKKVRGRCFLRANGVMTRRPMPTQTAASLNKTNTTLLHSGKAARFSLASKK